MPPGQSIKILSQILSCKLKNLIFYRFLDGISAGSSPVIRMGLKTLKILVFLVKSMGFSVFCVFNVNILYTYKN